MWQKQYETKTDVPAEKLFGAIADVNSWNKWDKELEFTKLDEAAGEGTDFLLKPKGGPKVKMTVEEFVPHTRFADISHLPLGKMRTIHEFISSGDGTTIKITIQVWGLLGFFWRRIIAEKQIKGAPAQTVNFINYARHNF
jgi:hypothetical protein